MSNEAGQIWIKEGQLADHIKNLGDSAAFTEMQVTAAVRALEAIAPVAPDLFQARKIGMEVIIPELVEDAFVLKHGEDGRKVIDFLRGNVTI